jgi:hypothetical protein
VCQFDRCRKGASCKKEKLRDDLDLNVRDLDLDST